MTDDQKMTPIDAQAVRDASIRQEGYRAGIEAAAKIADSAAERATHSWRDPVVHGPLQAMAREIADAIRVLAETSAIREAHLQSVDAGLVHALRAHEAWEAHVTLHADWSSGTPHLTRFQMNALTVVQKTRNAALQRASKAGAADVYNLLAALRVARSYLGTGYPRNAVQQIDRALAPYPAPPAPSQDWSYPPGEEPWR